MLFYQVPFSSAYLLVFVANSGMLQVIICSRHVVTVTSVAFLCGINFLYKLKQNAKCVQILRFAVQNKLWLLELVRILVMYKLLAAVNDFHQLWKS